MKIVQWKGARGMEPLEIHVRKVAGMVGRDLVWLSEVYGRNFDAVAARRWMAALESAIVLAEAHGVEMLVTVPDIRDDFDRDDDTIVWTHANTPE